MYAILARHYLRRWVDGLIAEWENAMTINCSCGQSYTAAQWPAGHYFVICQCGKPLLSRDGTGVTVGGRMDTKAESPVDTYPGDQESGEDAEPEMIENVPAGRKGRRGRSA